MWTLGSGVGATRLAMRRTVWLGVVVALHMLLAHTDAESKYYPLVFMVGARVMFRERFSGWVLFFFNV